MALAALLASTAVAALPDGVKGEYRNPTDAEIAANPALKDHMILDVTPAAGYGLDNVEKLKSTLGTEKARADNAEKELKPFKDAKIDPAKVGQSLERLAELEKIDPTKEADRLAEEKARGIKDQLVQAHNTEKSDWQKREQKLVGELDKATRIQAATTAIVEAGGNPDVLLPHVLGQTKFVEKDDGSFEVAVVDAQGNPRIGDAGGGAMNLGQLVEEFKAKDSFAPLFAASGKSGGGAQQQGPGGGGKTTGAVRSKADLADLNARAEFIEEHGQEAYLSLPTTAAA